MKNSISDYELRAIIAADGARPARAKFRPAPERRPEYKHLPCPAGTTRECGDCGRPMTAIDKVFICGCGRRDRLVSTTHEGAYGWVKTFVVQRGGAG